MGLKPFSRLPAPRVVNRPELPPDLVHFYAWHEGIGLESSPDYTVRLCTLNEARQVGWQELDPVGNTPEGWERFAAIRLGSGQFFDQVVYVLDAPSCPLGSVLTVGSVVGPGGDGPYALETSLVLGANFADWLGHLERWGWWEPAIGGSRELTDLEEHELGQYYRSLNPGLDVGGV